jgi:NAD(P)H-dependent FMN reductase
MTQSTNGIRVATILGTARPGNYTGKALALVVDELEKTGVEVTAFDPVNRTLGFPGENPTADAVELQEALKGATGVILATPEYHGTFSSMLKLIIENLGFPSALSGKPVALLGVASGRIGAIKSLEQLRCVCSHVGAIVLPGPVSVAGVNKLFDEEGNCLDPAVEKQICGLATGLMDFIHRSVCPRIALEAMVREQ